MDFSNLLEEKYNEYEKWKQKQPPKETETEAPKEAETIPSNPELNKYKWDEFIKWARLFYEWDGFDSSARDYKLEIADNIRKVREAGADTFVAGSAIFGAVREADQEVPRSR